MPGIPAPDSDRRPAWTARLVLGLAVVAVYANSLGVPFHLDDEVSILANESLHDLSDLRSVLWPRSEIFTAGRPLLNLTFALNYAWGGTSPAGYHVVNLAIHLAAVLLLAGLVRRTLLQPVCGARFTGSARWIATGTALLWGLHPVLTESVTYVSQRAESLMGLCYFGTLYAVVRAAEAERPRRWSAVAIGVCVAGMLVKEVMVTAPVATLVFDVAFLTGSLTESWRRRRGLYVGLAATWLVLAALLAGARIQDRSVGYGFHYTWFDYLRVECGAVLHYLRLALFPHPLVFDYGTKIPVPGLLTFLLQAGLLSALAAAVAAGWRRHRAAAFLGIWFFLTLAPTSSVVPVAGQPIAENRIYLPLAAVSTLLAVVIFRTAGRIAGAVVVCSLGAALGFGAILRNGDYGSDRTLWADTVRLRPENARARVYYGLALLRAGAADSALPHFENAVRLDPGYVHAHLNLGSLYLGRGRTAEALSCFQTAVRLRPANPVAHLNLGTALFLSGRAAEAERAYREALRLQPGLIDATLNLGIALAKLGRLAEARVLFEDVLRRQPDHAAARDYLQQVQTLQSAPAATPAR